MRIDLQELFQFIKPQLFISAVLSGPRVKQAGVIKITIRPIQIKEKLCLQATFQQGTQTRHQNLDVKEGMALIVNELSTNFKQAIVCTQEADFHILINKKGEATLLKKPPSKSETLSLVHNRPKEYILAEGQKIPFLMELGVMNSEGHVFPKKYPKFRQINRFLEFIEDIIQELPKDRPLQVIDFGCGKAYLTFALYYYLHEIKGLEVQAIGLDLKSDVVDFCQKTAKKLGFEHLSFQQGRIETHQADTSMPIDLVVSLHACDTATDAALAKAIGWNAQVILAVPCCQHEAYTQIQSDKLAVILRHGILKERFAALATDAVRAELLEGSGYRTQILEFIDMEHTPKNLLIRAVRKGKKKSLEEYEELKKFLHLSPALGKSFPLS